MLRHLQRCGHKPLALVGGATGMIGDPSGKSQERNLLNEETLRHNQECIKKQLAKFLDFLCWDSDGTYRNNGPYLHENQTPGHSQNWIQGYGCKGKAMHLDF